MARFGFGCWAPRSLLTVCFFNYYWNLLKLVRTSSKLSRFLTSVSSDIQNHPQFLFRPCSLFVGAKNLIKKRGGGKTSASTSVSASASALASASASTSVLASATNLSLFQLRLFFPSETCSYFFKTTKVPHFGQFRHPKPPSMKWILVLDPSTFLSFSFGLALFSLAPKI